MNERDLPRNYFADMHRTARKPVNKHNFIPGEKVNYGFNGDYNPGVVTRVSASSVWVRPCKLDTSKVKDADKHIGRVYGEEDADVTFVYGEPTAGEIRFRAVQIQSRGNGVRIHLIQHGGYASLGKGALFGRNPHI